ncbi:hypothetical protein DHEL01_v202149 [Diaporthe helianthi]|uniref:Acyltransferase 3 domain-containing protein n=1 Tax=Diaporthe helianthi TaxID=158607 RepID=A0A2P5IAC3_DIAHE|nr:hypothetical protein DHEL01_v202149 [Diaporthe helianthi]
MAVGKEGNVKWVDGLRGMASTLVVIKHVTCAFFPYLLWPAPSAEEDPVLFQRPYLRVLIQGRIGVAIFSFVTGYVCCLKPVRNFRAGNQNSSFNSISRSALRRVPRLVLPVLIILTASCFATQLGAFETAKHCDGAGIPETSPTRRDSLAEAIVALLTDMVRVWSHGQSEYGAELWTMMPILKGAFWVFIYLFATAHVKTRYRMMIALGLTWFRAASNDPFFGMQFFFGAFMADLQQLPEGSGPAWTSFLSQKSGLAGVRMLLSAFFLVTGLFIASLPDAHFEWQPWSQSLVNFMLSILPRNPDLPRFSSGLGLDLIIMSIHFSPTVRTLLATKPFLFFGKISFAVYLLHNQFLRSVLCWMVYGFSIPEPVQDPATGEWMPGPLLQFPGAGRLFAVLPIYFALIYGAGYLWIEHVDSWCARVTERICGSIKEETDEKSGPSLLPLANEQQR